MGALQRQSAQLFLERRDSERIDVKHNALGLTPVRADALDCQVLDLSVSGARVLINNAEVIPSIFKLFIPQAGWLYSCEVVRRDGCEVGVKFLTREPFTPFKFSKAELNQP